MKINKFRLIHHDTPQQAAGFFIKNCWNNVALNQYQNGLAESRTNRNTTSSIPVQLLTELQAAKSIAIAVSGSGLTFDIQILSP